MAMKWTTDLAVEETEREKKGAKKGQKSEMKYGQIGQEERQTEDTPEVRYPRERERQRQSLGKAVELRAAAAVQE